MKKSSAFFFAFAVPLAFVISVGTALLPAYGSSDSLGPLGPGDVLFERIDDVLPRDGSDDWYFDYSYSDGEEVRVGLNDDDDAGMTIKVYYIGDGGLTKVLEGHTNSGNFYGYVGTFTPTEEGEYMIIIVSDNGAGGYQYDVRARGI